MSFAIRSVPQLLASAFGVPCEGPRHCYYCGAPCDGARPATEFVRDSFTGRSEVIAPGSPAVCEGCVLCLRDTGEVALIDGSSRHVARGMMRSWSWVVTAQFAVAASKAHIAALRATCLVPPSPPWAIVLSDSGQKHLLYRGVVNRDSPPYRVTLEGETIAYRPSELSERLALCGRLAAATGKPALRDSITARFAVAVIERYTDGETLLATWDRVRDQPLSRLAGWLSPNKEECQGEYPADIPVPTNPGHRGPAAPARGPGRPVRPRGGRDGRGRDSGDGEPSLFDPRPPLRQCPGPSDPLEQD